MRTALPESSVSTSTSHLLLSQGKDPIKERERERREAAKADHTLSMIAEEAFEARKAELKGDGKAGRWFTPLQLHVLPKIGRVPVEDIDQQDIKDTLAPTRQWHCYSTDRSPGRCASFRSRVGPRTWLDLRR